MAKLGPLRFSRNSAFRPAPMVRPLTRTAPRISFERRTPTRRLRKPRRYRPGRLSSRHHRVNVSLRHKADARQFLLLDFMPPRASGTSCPKSGRNLVNFSFYFDQTFVIQAKSKRNHPHNS